LTVRILRELRGTVWDETEMSGTATRQSFQRPTGNAAARAREFTQEAWPSVWTEAPQPAGSDRATETRLHQFSCITVDLVLVCAGAAGAYWLRFGGILPSISGASHLGVWESAWSARYLAFLALYVGLIVLSCISQDLYRQSRERREWEEAVKVGKSVALATGLLTLFIFTSGHKEISRLVVGCSGVWNFAALAGWRYGKQRWELAKVRRGDGVSRVLIVGAGKLGRTLASWLEANRQLGYQVCGFLDAHPNGDARVLGSVRDLRKVALGHFVDELLVTLPADREVVKELLLEARSLRLNMKVIPDLYDGLGWHAPVATIGGFPVIELHGEPIPVFGLAIKRAIDVFGAAALLLVTCPLLAAAAIWIRYDSRGPIFYSAMRVGKKGRRFRCYKLRTMVAEADTQKEILRRANERNGPFFKMDQDPRVTRCGRWLRKYSIDELPQLINVLLGNMSLVGPRPHPIDDFERYTIEHLRRLDVKPGVTGLWQVTARRDPSFDTNMVLDLEYIEDWSLRLDLEILSKTVSVVLAGEGQ
jgi:exopolysaccharide biosynthesis polyprenyl glycosylphosphotransferase